jgi:hypothetical protein
MARIRAIGQVDEWFVWYALEQLAWQADLRVINDLADGLEALVASPEAAGNRHLQALIEERFGLR